MNHLDALESESIFIPREAYSRLKRLAMLWSMGTDSNVMIRLARKTLLGRIAFPPAHFDTGEELVKLTHG